MAEQANALVVSPPQRAIVQIKDALDSRIEDIAAVLPEGMKPERFVRTAILAISKSPDLMECSQASLVRSIVEAAEVGLEPTGSLSRAWLAPFKEKGKPRPEAKLMIGYQGLADLMRDTGRIRQVWAECVYEGDEFEWDAGAQTLRHVPAFATADPVKITFIYARARFNDGFIQSHVMTRAQVEAIRSRAYSRNSPAWVGSWPAMARKTALRQLANYVPLSTKAQGAIQRDDDAEFGTATPTEAPAARPSSLAGIVKARVNETTATDAPGAEETEEVTSESASDGSAAQQSDAASETKEEAPAVSEVCGVISEGLGCGPCIYPPNHQPENKHKDAKGDEWTTPKGAAR